VEAHNFVDGDLIEAFLELPADKMQIVADEMAVSVEELSKRVRDLERLH
jgi:DNA damage-binding protein 1